MAKNTSSIERIDLLYEQGPPESLSVNTFYHFMVRGPAKRGEVEWDDATTGAHVVAPVLNFTAVAFDEGYKKPLSNKDPIRETVFLPDKARMDEDQLVRARQDLKRVLRALNIPISTKSEISVLDFDGVKFTAKTRLFVNKKTGVERITISWPKFTE